MLRPSSPTAPATEIDRPTEFHLARQNQNLLQPDTLVELIAVMDEASLRREVGSHSVLRAQLERLLLHSESPSVTVQILPFDKGAHGALNGSFTILEFPDSSDPSVAYVDSPAGNLYLQKSEDMRRFERVHAAPPSTARNPSDGCTTPSKRCELCQPPI